jgi:nitroreductase
MESNTSITDIIRQRYSCRTYDPSPIDVERRGALAAFVAAPGHGPFGSPTRFCLAAAREDDAKALRGLGTYGFIRGASAFVIGAAGPGTKNLEDFGYVMEEIVLFATSLGLGTCWLGGTFTKSGFTRRIGLRREEVMPAVVSVGRPAGERTVLDRLSRSVAGSRSRLPWSSLFFDGSPGAPLSPEAAGRYAGPLEMVRLAPSASNKQPWRVMRGGSAWHFYLERTPGYLKGLSGRFVTCDLQRVDLGIAMSHFTRSAREAGLGGRWVVCEPGPEREGREYVASWEGQ